jgi:Ca-activated chloride channel family protein
MPAGSGLVSDTDSQAVNFCMVLDRSGSMAGDKLSHMKEAAKMVVGRLGPEDYLSIVVFDDEDPAELILPSAPVKDREIFWKKIDAIQERGGTHMSTGMKLGLEELGHGRGGGRVSSMLLLTDGQTWEDQDECRQLADQSRTSGIPIYALGLGVGEESDWDPRLLEDIAGRSGGEWVVVDMPDKVSAVFEKTLNTVQGTAVTNAFLTMRLVQGLTARTVWRVTPMISQLGHRSVSAHDVQVFLGDVQHGVGQSILADVLLPPRDPGDFRLIQADITYDVPKSGLTEQRVSMDLVLTFTEDAVHASQTDQRLMNIIERVVAHKLQTQALDEIAIGDAAKATQKLRAAATRLLELGEEEMADQANQQAQKIEQSGRMDPAAAQTMRYATKRLTEMDFRE